MADTQLPPPRPIDFGVPAIDGDRRIARRARRVRHRLRAVAVRAVVRERRLGRLLERELGPVAVVLHGRRTPAGDRIDHLVVAASGVWVVEACHECGRVERRLLRRDERARLRRRSGERVPLVPATDPSAAVQQLVARMGFGWLDVRRVICLTNAGWGLRRRPFELDGAIVVWGRALVDRIGVPGPLAPYDMRAVAVELNAQLPFAA